MTKVFCDRCGADITMNRKHMFTHSINYNTQYTYEMCTHCAELMVAVLQPPSEGASSPSR